jgi:predicted secreted hydrolase
VKLSAFVLAASGLLVAQNGGDFRAAAPDYRWSFPLDHWAHEGYRTEWWYFTGHLGERFAYQFTLFRIGLLAERPTLDSGWATSTLVMGHAALTDLEKGRHLFSEVLYREIPLLSGFGAYPERRIGWSRPPAGTGGIWRLDWNGEAFDFEAKDERQRFSFRLSTRPKKPLVLQGENGYSKKGEGERAASLYYSFTRLETAGEVVLDGERYDVSGESWMDKEFSSSQLASDQVGWDWFSLQLDDGRELMLYVMRRKDGTTDYAKGTLVSAAGEVRYLEGADFEVEVTDRWTSPETSARYPARWRLRALGLELAVIPRLLDQENRSGLPGGVYYWEGSVEIRDAEGALVGKGFVELTGYGEGNRPPV